MQSVVGRWGIHCVPYLKAVYKLRRLNEVRDVLIGASKQTSGATLHDFFFFFSSPTFIHHGGLSSALHQILSALAKLTVVVLVVVVLSYDSASTT